MFREEAGNSRGVVRLLSAGVEIANPALVVEDRRVDTHPATRRSCTNSEVPVFRAGQRLVEASGEVEYLATEEPRCLDGVTGRVLPVVVSLTLTRSCQMATNKPSCACAENQCLSFRRFFTQWFSECRSLLLKCPGYPRSVPLGEGGVARSSGNLLSDINVPPWAPSRT